MQHTEKIGDVDVVWNITPSDDNAYQNNLDAALLNQQDAPADDKIDIFLGRSRQCIKVCRYGLHSTGKKILELPMRIFPSSTSTQRIS